MPDASALIGLIRQVSLDAQEAAKPVQLCTGIVESSSPLRIRMEQKLLLGEGQLLVPRRFRTHTLAVGLHLQTGAAEGHSHAVTGETEATVRVPLAAGDGVLLARMQGGQQYAVLDVL